MLHYHYLSYHILYTIVIFFDPCENVLNYNLVVCEELCYYSTTSLLGVVDQLIHNIILAILISFLNVVLLIRIRLQKRHRMRHSIRWQQQCKMVLQLFSVSVLDLCGIISFRLNMCSYVW